MIIKKYNIIKGLQQFIAEAKLKKVYSDFEDALDALDWLENDVRPGEYGIASIVVDKKVGDLTFGFDSTTASRRDNNDAEELYLHCNALDHHYLNVTKDYEEMPRGEFADMVNDIIRKNGDKL